MVSLFPSSFFSFFFFPNSTKQTTQQHIFHHQSFAEGNSPLLFHFFLMFTDCKAKGLWRTGRADLSRGDSRGLADILGAQQAAPGSWQPGEANTHLPWDAEWQTWRCSWQLLTMGSGTQGFAKVHNLCLGHLHKANNHEQKLQAAGESKHQFPGWPH